MISNIFQILGLQPWISKLFLSHSRSKQLSILFQSRYLYILRQIWFFLLADIANVHLQNSLIIAKETIKTPALILNNVGNTACVQKITMVEQEKSMFFNNFFFNTKTCRYVSFLKLQNTYHIWTKYHGPRIAQRRHRQSIKIAVMK